MIIRMVMLGMNLEKGTGMLGIHGKGGSAVREARRMKDNAKGTQRIH
jgi:hypothetical protein